MTKTYELPNGKMIMADVDEKHHMATVSVYALDDLVEAVNKTGHWEWLTEDKYRCSNCNSETRVDECLYVKMFKNKVLEIIDKHIKQIEGGDKE